MRVLARHPRQDEAGILQDAWFGATVSERAEGDEMRVRVRFDDAATALFSADPVATVHVSQLRVGARCAKVTLQPRKPPCANEGRSTVATVLTFAQGDKVLAAIAPHLNPTVLAFIPATALGQRAVRNRCFAYPRPGLSLPSQVA
jgi:hypothetical protein